MLPTPYQEFIAKRSYSRWLPDEERREEWDETVTRYAEFFETRVRGDSSKYVDFYAAINAVERLEVMPSMRALWTAGPALEFDNVAGYNCAYTEVKGIRDFAEILYILMNGTGIGVSVERQVIAELPYVPNHIALLETPVVFEDSKEGWATGFNLFLECLFDGFHVKPDLSRIRPKGARLKTFGGRASGPEPLMDLLDFTARIIKGACGRRLNSEEVSDIVCKIAEIVIVGGVRRSAMLLLTNPSDRRMASYKQGEFWIQNPHRQLANISSCYTEKPGAVQFLEDFLTLMKNGNGERAFVNRESLQRSRGEGLPFGLNPCGEIILKPKQFCNLTEVVVRPDDTLESLRRKIKWATILGTLQATLSDFKFLSPEWTKNTEEDRLLGVSLTGIMDNESVCDWDIELGVLRRYAHAVNEEWSTLLGINPAKAITCVKPSGTVSQLVDSSSGIHPRFAEYYIRRVRVATTDPLCKLLQNSDVPWKPEVGELSETCKTSVFEFPCKARGATTTDIPALEQLDIWYRFKHYYTDHNPSVTIFVKEDEWVAVGCWLYKHWDYLGGITLLPFSGGGYKLAPYEEISAEKFAELEASFPALDFTQLSAYEYEDNTEGSREYACVGGSCEL